MLETSALADNLLSPPVLCFALGVIASLCRSDLRFPEALTQTLSIYLLFAIGMKGGISLRGGESGIFAAAGLTLVVGMFIPLVVYVVATRLGRWGGPEGASLAAHYGSTSAVTFLAAIAFLERNQSPIEGYVPALLAIMEVPAIVVGLLLAKKAGAMQDDKAGNSISSILVHILCGKTVLLLIGGMAIGMIATESGLATMKPFLTDPFAGILALFLLELGLIAGASLPELRRRIVFLLPFGIIAPLAFGSLSVALATAIGMSAGGATAFGILAGSASYIAAPAAMRMACPQVDHGISLAGSLGVTFPFNLALGIPLLAALANSLAE